MPRPTLAALRDIIGADDAEYFELRREDKVPLAAAQSHDWPEAPGSEEAMVNHGWQNPLGFRKWTPADGALRLSESVGSRELTRLDFYQEYMRPNRLRDTLKVWLSCSPVSVACVQLWRHDTTFRPAEQAILAVLHQGLVALREEGLRADGSAPMLEARLTTRECEVLVLACRGASDEVVADLLGMSPATAGKHLEHAYEKLGVHSRAEALWFLMSRPARDRSIGAD